MNLNKKHSTYQKVARDEIENLVKELEREKNKPQQIEIKEKEVVKLEPKCTKCNQSEFTYMLGRLKFITYGALVYSIIITIINIIKNEILKSDFKTFFESAWIFLQMVFKKANMGFLKIVSKVDNNILHRVIHIGLWLLAAGVLIFGFYKMVKEMQYKTWKFWNIGAVGMILLDLIVIVFLSEPIKIITNLNLFIFALMFYAAYILIRIIVNIIKARR